MKIIILDDLDTEPLTEGQEKALSKWFEKMEHLFPHGNIQVFQLPRQKDDLYKRLLGDKS